MNKAIRHLNPFFLLLLLFLWGSAVFASNNKKVSSIYNTEITAKVRKLCVEQGIDTAVIKIEKWKEYLEERIYVPRGKPLVEVAFSFWQVLNSSHVKLVDVLEMRRKKHKEIVFTFVDNKENKRKIILAYGGMSHSFKLALVLRGIENADPELVKEFLLLSHRFAYMVTPDFVDSACSILKGRGELILNVPMESAKRRRHKKGNYGTIYLQSSSASIKKTLRVMKKSSCSVKGVSHPLRSIILTDMRVMRIILEEVRKRKAYFLEIGYNRNSVVSQATKQEGVPYLFCRYTIDGHEKEKALRQFKRLIIVADKTGGAIAVANITLETLEIINGAVPDLAAHGIRISAPSELISYK